MITETGHFALILAFLVALVQASLPLIGAQKGNRAWMALAAPAATMQFLLIAIAFAVLVHAFVTSDFSVLNVVRNSHTDKPLIYKISGSWGNHEGSLLLWVTILAAFGWAVAMRPLPPGLKARVLAVQAMVAVGFLAFMLLTSNPFERLDPAPLNGHSLNPLLQDIGLALHPPMLYLGYVGFSMAFSFAIAALIEGRVDPAWARWVRPWTLAAWLFLTAGIALGSWWAYYELGWGGWWFWDPVENASLMPWLSGTALLHSAIVVEKRNALKTWTILLAIITFAMSLMGTFLVRSGVLTSVHAFATDPERGVFILLLLMVTIGGSLALFAARAKAMEGGGLFAPISREGALVINNLFLTAGLGVVFFGTLYPLFLDVAGGSKITVGAPFFNQTFVPMMVPLVFLMAFGPLLSWKRSLVGKVVWRLGIAFVLAVVIAAGLWILDPDGPVLAGPAIGLGVWLLVGSATELAERLGLFRRPASRLWHRLRRLPGASWGTVLAHGGLAIAIIGMAGSAFWTHELIRAARPGEDLTLAGYRLHFEGERELPVANYIARRARFTVYRGDRQIAVLAPEERHYPASRSMSTTTEAAIRSTLAGDLYIAVGDRDEISGLTTVRAFFNPLVPWMWAGSVLMVLGGVISLTDRRYRIGAPRQSAARTERSRTS